MGYTLPLSLSREIFRAYDIRGIVDETITESSVYAIGLAIGSQAQSQGEKTIIVARDGRLSGPRLIEALIQGLRDSGCNVIDIGCVPTPVLYFATHVLETRSGIMLTGSHNPSNYNGLKIVIQGETLSETGIGCLYQRIIKRDFTQGNGRFTTLDMLPRYLERITQDVQLNRRLKVVIDCGNGVAGVIAPALFKKLGCEVIELFCDIDGHFPNHHPDPSVPENLQDLIAAVKTHQADIGLAFDGDADRIGVVTDTGEIIWPDRQLMLYASDVLARNPGATIIYDVKCTNLLENVIRKADGQPVLWKTGHSLIKAKLRETGALLAGEMSGHIFFKERWFGFDDGLYTAARLLEIIAAQNQTVSNCFAEFPDNVNTPELKLAITEEHKFSFMEAFKQQASFAEAAITTIDGLRADYTYGWGLIRPSNTSPYLVLRFEANNSQQLAYIQQQFREQLLAIDMQLALPF
jgi:phosphomannomutase/phosphoglucomutase